MPDQLNPTITLAELYENQDQLLDALMVYQKLLHRNPSTELEEKISNLKQKIFADDEMQYNPVIEQIFSQNDRLQFNILPHSNYKQFRASLKQPKLDSMNDIEETESEPIISEKYNKELENVFKEFEQEHKEELVPQSTTEQPEEESAEIFTDEISEQEEDPDQYSEAADIETTEKNRVEETPKKQNNVDFFDISFEDLTKTFEEDQLTTEDLEKQEEEKTAAKTVEGKQVESKTEKADEDTEEALESSQKKADEITKHEDDSVRNLNFEPLEKARDEKQEKVTSETKSSPKEDMESLSFEKLVAKLDEAPTSGTKQKSSAIKKEREEKSEPSPPESQIDKKRTNPISKTEELNDEAKKKKTLPFEYVEEDVSLKELEAELKAEFQKTKKQTFPEVREETPTSEDNSKTDIKPVLDDDESEQEALDPDSKITPEFLEKIIASNKSENLADEIQPLTSDKKDAEESFTAESNKIEKEQQEPEIKQKVQPKSTQSDDLEFTSDPLQEDIDEKINEKESKTSDPEDLSFDMTEEADKENIEKKQSEQTDLGDLDKPFDEIAAETEKKLEVPKETKTNELEKGFDEIKPEKEKKEDKERPENIKRFSEYVPGASQSEEAFFSNSFDDITKQSNELNRSKNLGFKADDVIKKEDKDNNDKKED